MKNMKKIIVVVVSIIMLGYIIFGINSCTNKKEAHALKIKTAVVHRGDLMSKVTNTGSVQPKTTVQIKSNVGGEIVRLPVKEGDWVEKGDLLVELDTTNLKNKLSQSEADLATAKAKLSTLLAGERPQEIDKTRELLHQAEIKLEDAKIKLDRQNGLFSQGFISKQDVDTAQRECDLTQSIYNSASLNLSLMLEGAREQDITSAKASVLKAEVAYEQAASDVSDAMIYAPLSGTILEKNVEEGEKITSGIGNNSGGTVILTIGDLSTMQILTMINEVDIATVKIGQDVEITLDAIKGEKYQGRVTDIASLGKVENNIVTYDVVVEILGVGSGRQEVEGRSQEKAGIRQAADGRWKRGGDREIQGHKGTEGGRSLEFGVRRRQKAESRWMTTDDRRLKAEEGISRVTNP
ncbi:MAG: HlyD family efflux transporter periplasmic adaptor subunit, partial [Candidatus Desantisbacteria bacterium]